MGRTAVVVGAGLAGLACAHHLSRSGWDVTVVERDQEIGGRLRTVDFDGQPVDVGATFIANFNPTVLSLIRETGVERNLYQRSERAAVYKAGAAYPAWPAPQLLKGHLLGYRSRLQLPMMLGALARHWRSLDARDLLKAAPIDDELVSDWTSRTLGQETADLFVAPLLRGLFYWDPQSTSAAVLFVMLKAALQKHGAFRLSGGFRVLTDALAGGLQIRTSTAVTAVHASQGGRFAIDVESGNGEQQTLTADAVVCCATARSVRDLFAGEPRVDTSFFEAVTYSRTAVVVFRLADSAPRPEIRVLFPVQEVPELASVNPHIPFDTAVGVPRFVKVYVSDQGYSRWHEQDDQALAELVLRRATGIPGVSDWAVGAIPVGVVRWPEALPRFDVGHLKTLASTRPWESGLRGLAFAGDYLGGPYLEGAASSGVRAARVVSGAWPRSA